MGDNENLKMTAAHLRDAYPLLDGSVTTGKGPNTH